MATKAVAQIKTWKNHWFSKAQAVLWQKELMQSSAYKKLSSRKKVSARTLVKKHYKNLHPLLIFILGEKWKY